ncbi:MAG: helicase-exonuclease AddAB subunit AddA [Oscillospiraceae bacterium]|nr:helicase-exonuclease AddAB subunit AddA [Oscillospiraceae bacterium]
MPIWTDAQKKAIYEPSGEGSILVSAAAGSGKTAVLVERIANMIMRDEDRVSVDELLVVTFTEAAAAEMRERIVRRINEEYRLQLSKGNALKAKYLREQINLTASADINTIDSFCLNVVKNNFHVLGVDPNFSIMDNNERDMLMDDTLSELFMSLYATENEEEKERFNSLVNIYASNRDDEGLKRIIRKVYNFIQSFPSPEEWLREKADMYSDDMTESKWIKDIFLTRHRDNIILRHESFWQELIDKMLDIVKKHYNINTENIIAYEEIKEADAYWGKIWSNVCKCREAVSMLKTAEGYDDIYGIYKTYIEKKSYLGSAINAVPKKKEASDDEWQYYYNEYNYMRDNLRQECMKMPVQDRSAFNAYLHSDKLKKHTDDIVWLTELFIEMFEEKKNKKNEKTFSDIEHLAYRLFRENENIRGEYAQRYREILIDEYQDTNGLQDAIFTSISRDNKNMFMVGDLKQSIYRFRGGDPTIFKNKSKLFGEGDGKRIVLSQNFRSRKEVLRSINSIFSEVMSDEVGDVVYGQDEELKRDEDRECYIDGENLESQENIRSGYSSELHTISVFPDEDTEEEITADRAEAKYIAERIRALVDGHYKVHAGNGKYRDIEYRDIVILMRSVKSSGDMLSDMLAKFNIPAFVQKEEYFERREIKLILSLISLINNHMQDIPLVAVMRSPIGGFSENELAMIKIDYKGKSFYKAVKNYKTAENNLNEKEKRLRDKCRRFINDIDRWRGYVKIKPIAQLIWTLYEETNIYDFMGALEGGEEAQANLKLLYERAKRYEESGFKGIFNFIRYIERMENRHDDISGARLVNESHNVVRIMTIHKSKGLEFPVVFLARTTKKFNAYIPGDETRIRLHKDFGIGVDYYDYEDMYCKKLIFNTYIKDESDREHRSEEMRLMYVAMTRAKEKLIVTSSRLYKSKEDYDETMNALRLSCAGYAGIRRAAATASCYNDWITPAVMKNGECWAQFERSVSSLEYAQDEDTEKDEIIIENPDEVRAQVRKILEFSYKYPLSGAIPAKTSVTAIKEMEDEEHSLREGPVYMIHEPEFMRSEKRGAQIGTAHHQVMAYIDIDKMKKVPVTDYEEFVGKEIKRIVDMGQLENVIAEDEKLLDEICKNVCSFFRSEMGKAIFAARRVYREKPFEIEITANEYDRKLDGVYIDEKVIVQGIIDLYFEDSNGDIILVDYKTDRCRGEEEKQNIALRYSKQLELYGMAMEKILKKSVKDKYLYLFSAKSVVKLD